jgi:hypothetical protein
MSSPIDHINKLTTGFVILLIILFNPALKGQEDILNSKLTISAGTIKTVSALDMISRQTGYYFTYDSKLFEIDKKTELNAVDIPLHNILDSIFRNDSIRYSVVKNHIIIYKYKDFERPAVRTDTVQPPPQNYISGKIVDNETGEVLPYAAIGIISKGSGTVTNLNGEFGLKIMPDYLNDSLSVSYLGYVNQYIPVKQALGNYFTIKLIREYISIPEIIIKTQAPLEIIRKSLAAIPENYGNTPASLTGFYREAVKKRTELQVYSEAVLQIYKSAYSGSLYSDQIKVVKSRKIENTGLKDTLTLRLKAGLGTCLQLDGVKKLFDFLDPENYQSYNYMLTDIVTIDDESAYVVEFVQKGSVDIPLYKGSVYIHTDDFSILMAEFELNPDFIDKSRDSFIANSTRGYSVRPASAKYLISYRKINNRYFLNHVRGDLKFSAKEKKRLFNTSFNVFFELAITNVDLANVTRFERDEVTPLHTVFSKTIVQYDPDFWGDQDFLKPEDDLLDVIKNMNVRLLEFSKEGN